MYDLGSSLQSAIMFTQPLHTTFSLNTTCHLLPHIPYSTPTRAPSWHVCHTFMHAFLNYVAPENGTELFQSLRQQFYPSYLLMFTLIYDLDC